MVSATSRNTHNCLPLVHHYTKTCRWKCQNTIQLQLFCAVKLPLNQLICIKHNLTQPYLNVLYMKCTVNVSSDEFPTFWVLHKFSCLLHSVIRGNNNSLLGLACYGPYHLIYTHLPHNVEKRLKLSLKKMLFFPQKPSEKLIDEHIYPLRKCALQVSQPSDILAILLPPPQ